MDLIPSCEKCLIDVNFARFRAISFNVLQPLSSQERCRSQLSYCHLGWFNARTASKLVRNRGKGCVSWTSTDATELPWLAQDGCSRTTPMHSSQPVVWTYLLPLAIGERLELLQISKLRCQHISAGPRSHKTMTSPKQNMWIRWVSPGFSKNTPFSENTKQPTGGVRCKGSNLRINNAKAHQTG